MPRGFGKYDWLSVGGGQHAVTTAAAVMEHSRIGVDTIDRERRLGEGGSEVGVTFSSSSNILPSTGLFAFFVTHSRTTDKHPDVEMQRNS